MPAAPRRHIPHPPSPRSRVSLPPDRLSAITLPMACSSPSSASEVFCRAAKCRRWSARLALFLAFLLAVIMVKAGNEFIRDGAYPHPGVAERITGFLAVFLTQATLLCAALFYARRGFSAAHHASVKSNNLKALELLAAQATDEATKKDLLTRAADLVAGKPGCCK